MRGSHNYSTGLKELKAGAAPRTLDAAVPHIGALRLHYSYGGGGCDLLALFFPPV